MATERLIVELDADSSKLNKGLGKASVALDKLDGKTKKSDK